MGHINELLVKDLPAEQFVTFVVAFLDPSKSRVQLISAGHGPLLLYTAANDQFQNFEAQGIPFGLVSGFRYGPPQEFEMAPGDMLVLTDEDAPEMLALATLTEPGPFLARTHTIGTFLGIRIGGRLAAMAGERMRFPGYTEVSGVCTHPEFRGRGLARRLSAAVTASIQARGDQPFLHAWKTNHSAISLYEGLGFKLRTEVNAAVLKRVGIA